MFLLADVLIIRKTIFLNMGPYILRFELQPFYFGISEIKKYIQPVEILAVSVGYVMFVCALKENVDDYIIGKNFLGRNYSLSSLFFQLSNLRLLHIIHQ